MKDIYDGIILKDDDDSLNMGFNKGRQVEKKKDMFDMGDGDEVPEFESDYPYGTYEYEMDVAEKVEQWNARKKYQKYIDEHHPAVPPKKKEDKIAMVSKALAAEQLKKDDNTYKYSTRLINFMAGKIEKALDMSNMPEEDINKMIKSQAGANQVMNNRLKDIYDVVMDPKAYVVKMKRLYENLMSKEKRTDEYKAFHDSVKTIATMDAKNMSNAELRDALIVANFDLLRSIETYMKGKKSVRRNQDGRDRFDNALDALSIMTEGTSGVKAISDKLVNRINKVRGYKPGHKYHVNLDNYGYTRAEQRMQQRKDKKLEMTMKLSDEKKMDRAMKPAGI